MEQADTVVVDVRIPFWSMVILMVKWVIASIPAMIILFMLVVVGTAFLSAFTTILTGLVKAFLAP